MSFARLHRAFALWALGLALLAGTTVTLQAGYGFEQFGAIGMAARVAALAIMRELGPAVAAAAVLYALVTWAHGIAEPELRPPLRRALLRVSAISFAALPVIAGIEAAASMAVLRVVFGQPWSTFFDGAAQMVDVADLATGVGAFAFNLALYDGLAWLLLPWLARTRVGLGATIAAAWALMLFMRLVVWLLFARSVVEELGGR